MCLNCGHEVISARPGIMESHGFDKTSFDGVNEDGEKCSFVFHERNGGLVRFSRDTGSIIIFSRGQIFPLFMEFPDGNGMVLGLVPHTLN